MLKGTRTDLAIENNMNNKFYHLITYDDLLDYDNIENKLIKEIKYFLNKLINKNSFHVFIVGLGNDNNTTDSIGPKVIEKIHVNSHLNDLGIKVKNKISALEPGVLGTTGISTKKIVESIVKEINPDLVIIIDSYVTKDFKYLNKSIQISDEGIIPGSGFNSKEDEISYKTLKVPVIVIGVTTAIEIKNNNHTYIVSTKDIDYYVTEISDIISDSLNTIFE